MAEFNVNKGIGKPAEFRGLQSQYLFIFAGGLLTVFIVFVIMYMAGVNQWICILFGVGAATTLVWLSFTLNKKYGEHGLMKLQARMYHPRYLINRLRISRFFQSAAGNGRPDTRRGAPENVFNVKLKIANDHEKHHESSHSGE